MKVNIKRASDTGVPLADEKTEINNNSGFLATPSVGQKNRKPRDSFTVMRIRSHKHTIGITVPEK